MNDEEKYKEALARARECLKDGGISQNTIDYLCDIFPELSESDDERIRKALIELVKFSKKSCFELLKDQSFNIVSMDAMLAWLEKQGNSPIKWNKNTKDCKPKVKHSVLMETTHGIAEGEWQGEQWYQYRWACLIKDTEVLSWIELSNLETQVGTPKEFTITYENKVGNGNVKGLVTRKVQLPKFKVGDWVVANSNIGHHTPLQIVDVDNSHADVDKNMYRVVDVNGNSGCPRIEDFDCNYHLWTIADAKEGDVLANDNNILILKELVYNWSSDGTPNSVKAYCGIKPNGNFEIGKDNWCFCGTLHIHPATKEQRDILFAKMREAGYEWNAENKELKKIETKFKAGDWIVSPVLGTAHIIGVNDSNEYQIEYIDGRQEFSSIDYVNYAYDKWTIEDAKPGDVLNSKGVPFIYKKHDKDCVYFYCGINLAYAFMKADNIDIWDDNFKVYPATKEQRDLLFKRMLEEGYEWDAENKELMKIESKFKAGDWIYHMRPQHIASKKYGTYYFDEGSALSTEFVDKYYHLWTIEDAEDGDVLAAHECYVIFKEIEGLNIKCYCTYHYMNNPSFYVDTLQNKDAFHPATEEQRETLMKAITDAGYRWDAEKKQLSEIF